MRVVKREWGNLGTTPVMWISVEGAGEWPTDCGCDCNDLPTEILDQIRDYGCIMQRNWVHRRPDGKRRFCVLIGLRHGTRYIPMTQDAYAEYNREYVRAYDERNPD